MKKTRLFLLLLTLTGFVFSGSAQQIKVDKATNCPGNLSKLTIPPFVLPASTNIESYTFYVSGDTVTTTENEYSKLFDPGTYAASAKIVLSNGTTLHTNSITFQIVTPPIANFSLTNGNTFCNLDSAVCITNTSVQTAFPISKILVGYDDGFGDSFSYNIPSFCRHFAFPGIFRIGIRVIDSIGCSSDTSLFVTIHEQINPMITWEGAVNCSGSSYTFTNYRPLYGIQNYTWHFGDGQTYSATRPFTNDQLHHIDSITHYYTIDGVFSPSLSITDTNGCSVVQSQNYVNPFPLPANIVTNGKIHSSSQPSWAQGPDEQVFCFNPTYNTVYFTPPTNTQFNFQQNWPFDALWNYDDPSSLQQNIGRYANEQHQFMQPGKHIVKLDLSASYPNCIFYDTIELVGPLARIENKSQPIPSVIAPWQKNQISGNDTVDFVNNTVGYGVQNKISFVWDFMDEFAPVCTAYSVPKPGVPLPFTTAQEQYENSNHFYIRNGVTFSGKMNCKWSLDSLPRHTFTNWDSVYAWYSTGKQFPASWGLNPILSGTPVYSFSNNEIPDPFLLAQGKIVNLPNGLLQTPSSIFTYTTIDGSTITHNGMDLLPNSTITFHRYLFNSNIAHNYGVYLKAVDSFGKGCPSEDMVELKFGKPDAHKLKIRGKQCPGAGYGSDPNGIIFDLSNLNNTTVLINFDSLADRKDATPCAIDGFVDFQGGVTPGGLNFPPFFATPNFMPMPWQDGAQSRLFYHYGLNAPLNRRPPADSVNGYVTIGIIIGSGCANPPFCTQAESYSDTLWFHNILQIRTLIARFNVQNKGALFSKNDPVTVTPDEPYQPAIQYDSWIWGDGTMTADSFRYASDYNLPENLTNGYFVNGKRRVRYQFTSSDNYNFIVADSLPFPTGLPGAKFTIDSIINNSCSLNNPAKSYILKDSAMLLLPLTHRMNQSSYEFSGDKKNPTINQIIHFIGSTKGCSGANAVPITVGIIDSIETTTNTFCLGESVNIKGFTRYFRCDNSFTSLPINPNYSCESNTYYNAPYNQLNFDTIDFWNRNKNQTATIKYTYLNTATGKTDTVFYEKMYWNFGDGSPLFQGYSPTHQYTSPGNYTLSMITRDSVGGWDTCTKQITVSNPIAKIGLPLESFPPYLPKTVINCGQNAILIDSSEITTGDSIITNYWWFGDQNDSMPWQQLNAAQVNRKYKSNGLYKTKLVIETQLGCRDTAYANIFVKGPRPHFEVISGTSGCPPFTVRLVNNADGKRKFLKPDGTTYVSDTPTIVTYFDMGDLSTQIPVVNRRDTIEYTYTTGGEFSIVAYGSDTWVGGTNYCPFSAFPDGILDAPIVISVSDVTTNGIVGKHKVGLAETWNYSVSRTPGATYTWDIMGGAISSNNPDFSTVAILWSTVDGNYRIVCNKSINGCTSRDTLLVKVGTPPPVGINETSSAHSNISIFPNPAHNRFTVKLNTTVNSPIQVALYDLIGKNYLSETIPSGSKLEHTFDIQSLKAGIYLIEVISENERSVYKLLVE